MELHNQNGKSDDRGGGSHRAHGASAKILQPFHSEHSPNEAIHAAERANVNTVRINLGGSTLLVVILLSIIIGVCGVVMGFYISREKSLEDMAIKADTECRLVDDYLTEHGVHIHEHP